MVNDEEQHGIYLCGGADNRLNGEVFPLSVAMEKYALQEEYSAKTEPFHIKSSEYHEFAVEWERKDAELGEGIRIEVLPPDNCRFYSGSTHAVLPLTETEYASILEEKRFQLTSMDPKLEVGSVTRIILEE